jgi:phosphoribosylformylglycinamidine cyclo-ligase
VRSAVLSRIGLDSPLAEGTAAEVLLAPSVVYSPAIQHLLAAVPVAAMAHVTGGGITSNLARVLPGAVDAVIERDSWPRPPVFAEIAAIGGITEADMFTTFNMGVGFLAIVSPDDVAAAQQALGTRTHVIGTVVDGSGAARLD